jgi:hypothetical protein
MSHRPAEKDKGRRGGLYFVGGSIHFDPIERFVVISGVLSRLL